MGRGYPTTPNLVMKHGKVEILGQGNKYSATVLPQTFLLWASFKAVAVEVLLTFHHSNFGL
jgi:hypothetical protein